MERVLTATAQRRLADRAPLPVDPSAAIAVKRDVHEFIVDCDAAMFAAAFRAVVTDPTSTFGLIRVKRAAERMGRDFEIGERFQGCFSLERATLARLPAAARGLAERVLGSAAATALLRFVEDALLSNYAEVVAIETDGSPYRLEYRYLDGTPIAGSSVFTIDEAGPGRCRVRQIFEYQEVNGVALGTFQRFGLKYHDQVVQREIELAADRAGARVISGTIPAAYRELA
jgi:hypothetical protein